MNIDKIVGKKIYVGVTNNEWFNFLKENKCSIANFWRINKRNFSCLKKGDLFLFKLHSPFDFIVGGGTFDHYEVNTIPTAWKRFGINNGVASLPDLMTKFNVIKEKFNNDCDQEIGCIILKDLFFLNEPIEKPSNFVSCIVSGKTYVDNNIETKKLQDKLVKRLNNTL